MLVKTKKMCYKTLKTLRILEKSLTFVSEICSPDKATDYRKTSAAPHEHSSLFFKIIKICSVKQLFYYKEIYALFYLSFPEPV